MSDASSVPYMPFDVAVRPSTTARMSVCLSAVRPIAVRGCLARMSLRSGKQVVAVGSAQVTAAPSMTTSGKPLTSESVPGRISGATVSGFQPVAVADVFFTCLVCVKSTQSWPKAIHP